MSYYAILDIKKIKGAGGLSSQEAHNNRDYPMRHVDENLSYLNRDIVTTGGISYRERWKEITEESEAKTGVKIKVRSGGKSGSVWAFNMVMAFSPGAEKDLNINLSEWCEANRQWVADTFGESNILAMQLHLDEVDELEGHGRRGAHIHAIVVPIDERGHLCARTWCAHRVDMKKLQSSYGKAMEQFGLERGEPNSKLKHTDRKRWYHAVSKLCNEKAPRMNENESLDSYYERLDKAFQDVSIKAAKAVEKAEKALSKSETRQAQIFGEYAYAVNLQHILEESYGGDMSQVNERLKNYQTLENCVPRKNLSTVIDKLKEKYPPENNLAFYRRKKKKKHAKWESLPDESQQTSGGSQEIQHIMEFPTDDEPEEENQVADAVLESEVSDVMTSSSQSLGNAFGEELED